jgi:hypothetical protein
MATKIMVIKFTKMTITIPNGHKITQNVPSQGLQKNAKIHILVWKYVYHLATLLKTKEGIERNGRKTLLLFYQLRRISAGFSKFGIGWRI